jgi:hypothetical protein
MEESATRTPGWLMRGGLLEPWGPPTGATSLSDTIVRLAGERVPLSRARIIDLCADRPERWLLVGLLAETRASAVYRAIDRELGRPVAIKVHRDTDEAKMRARTEAHVAAIARDPHVVAVHDFATWEGLSYTIFELCDTDLDDWHVGRPWREILSRIIEAGQHFNPGRRSEDLRFRNIDSHEPKVVASRRHSRVPTQVCASVRTYG